MSYYHGLISSRKANSILVSNGNGSFLIRDSQSQPGSFVLTAKSGGRVYHVLIFHQGGQYHLDSDGDQSEEPLLFDSLDELVVFCTGHELRVEGDEIQLNEAVPSSVEPALPTEQEGKAVGTRDRKTSKEEDSDQITNLLATLFGAHCSVVSMVHSSLNFDGQPLEEGREFLVVVAKDTQQKGFFLRIVDPEKKTVVGEKKITKTFQYDTPGDQVMTYLSEHGITCVGFRDPREKERFLRQVDRVVRLQQDRAVKLRARVDSENKAMQSPTELTHRIKASEFDIDHLSLEWQYLFDLAGVTRAMLEDRATLQFILDTLHQIGGAPRKLEQVKEEALSDTPSQGAGPGDVVVQRKRERMQALAVDHALRRESLRASKLANELKKKSLRKDSPMLRHDPGCAYKLMCEGFKDYLTLKHSLFALGPENSTCFCQHCLAGKPLLQVSGSPPQQYTLPVGWCRFVHRSRSHVLAQQFCARWHLAYCVVPSSRVAGVMRTGQLLHSHSSGEVLLSPDILCAARLASITPESYTDDVTGQTFKVNTAFQVYIQPDTYSVHAVAPATEPSGSLLHSQLEWHVSERTYIVHALLIQMLPCH